MFVAEVLFGSEEPRIWTKPLRELTPETSLGFEVIEFALTVLGIVLYPWQKWLLIHALELLPSGDYRFRRVVVLVARQNGKTLLGSVLTAWWLFKDSKRNPKRLPPVRFKVVGVAQNLDIAREPWAGVKLWADPKPETEEEADLAIAALQKRTAKVVDTNGKESIVCRNRAHYEIRAAGNTRGKPAARVLMDETREQTTWRAWNAVSQTLKSFGNLGQLWAISNAGDPNAVVLIAQRGVGLKSVARWEEYVESGIMSAEDYANQNDVSLGLFEWSAPDGCELDDVEAILQANPSVGHGELTVEAILSDMPPAMTEAGYRTEVLCQWVTARVEPHIDPTMFAELADAASKIDWSRPVACAVDVSHDRQRSHIAVAGFREDGLVHVELVASRAGMLWVPAAVAWLHTEWGVAAVAVQGRGCAAGEFAEKLRELVDEQLLTLEVLEIVGPALGAVAGGVRDRVQAGTLRHLGQESLRIAVEGGMAKHLNEVMVFDRANSPVDVSPLIAEAEALWALEHLPELDEAPPPPPAAGVLLVEHERGGSEVNLAVASF